MKPSVAIFFDSNYAPQWNWKDFISGDVGLSGTDSQNLHLAYRLHQSGHYHLCFLSNSDHIDGDVVNSHYCSTLADAILWCKKNAVDILIFNNRGNQQTTDAILLCNKVQLRCIVWDQNGFIKPLKDFYKKHDSLKRIVCVSKYQLAQSFRHKIFNKSTYIYNAFLGDVSSAEKKSHEGFNICFIGALNETKGFHWVCEAWPVVKKSIPTATLHIIGSVALHDATRKLGRLGVAEANFEEKYIFPNLGTNETDLERNQVIFHGLKSRKEIQNILNTIDLGIVNPNIDSSNETFCVSALDFQAQNISVIGGKSGGLKETINNQQTGLLVSDPKRLATAITDLYSDPIKRKALSELGSTWVQQFSPEHVDLKWHSLIADVLSDRTNPSQLMTVLNKISSKSVLIRMARELGLL